MIILESFISMFWDIAPIIGMILIFPTIYYQRKNTKSMLKLYLAYLWFG